MTYNVFWRILVNLRVLIPNPMNARRETLSVFVKPPKFKMAAKTTSLFIYLRKIVCLVWSPFYCAEYKFDECGTKNLERFCKTPKFKMTAKTIKKAAKMMLMFIIHYIFWHTVCPKKITIRFLQIITLKIVNQSNCNFRVWNCN